MNYFYKIYNKFICCNKKLFCPDPVKEIDKIGKDNLIIDIQIDQRLNNEKMGLVVDGKGVYIRYRDLSLDMFFENRIIVKTHNIQNFEKVFYNVPLSIFCLYKGELILHCSSVLYNEELNVFLGAKGIGKSTLASKLWSQKIARLYADDTLLISGKKAFAPHHVFKISEEIYNENNFKNMDCIYRDSYRRKVWVKYKDIKYNFERNISNIYILERNEGMLYKKLEIKQSSMKEKLLQCNIVGINKMDVEQFFLIKKNLECGLLAKNTKMYLLKVPNEGFVSKNSDIEKIFQ